MSDYKPVASVVIEFSIDKWMEEVEDLIARHCYPSGHYEATSENLFGLIEDLLSDHFRQQMEEANNCTDEKDYWKNDCFDHFHIMRMEEND